ncbi:hypothetical protein JL721_12721 [Aureococcus anophagefferens]|nr:hypothetical protein JL721_12721 [Aureococcus anophagefferens]
MEVPWSVQVHISALKNLPSSFVSELGSRNQFTLRVQGQLNGVSRETASSSWGAAHAQREAVWAATAASWRREAVGEAARRGGAGGAALRRVRRARRVSGDADDQRVGGGARAADAARPPPESLPAKQLGRGSSVFELCVSLEGAGELEDLVGDELREAALRRPSMRYWFSFELLGVVVQSEQFGALTLDNPRFAVECDWFRLRCSGRSSRRALKPSAPSSARTIWSSRRDGSLLFGSLATRVALQRVDPNQLAKPNLDGARDTSSAALLSEDLEDGLSETGERGGNLSGSEHTSPEQPPRDLGGRRSEPLGVERRSWEQRRGAPAGKPPGPDDGCCRYCGAAQPSLQEVADLKQELTLAFEAERRNWEAWRADEERAWALRLREKERQIVDKVERDAEERSRRTERDHGAPPGVRPPRGEAPRVAPRRRAANGRWAATPP